MSQVEHVVREEKLRAAYELVEIYCELIAARLPMVEAQKYVFFLHFIVMCGPLTTFRFKLAALC